MADILGIRHALHQIPELAFAEHKTKALILTSLHGIIGDGENWLIKQFANSTGILVAYSPVKGKYRLFRADMDALPVTEPAGCEFASLHSGYMHACGHDVHISVLLGLIQEIAQIKPERNLLFLFQPAEEGKGGAQAVLSEGLIQAYDVESAFALHVAGDMPVGTISSKAGIFFGIPQEFNVNFAGKAAHVAYPEKGINALQAGMDFMNLMRAPIAELSRTERVIFHVGKMSGGSIRNIIADSCVLEGTHRSLSKNACAAMNSMIIENASLAAKSLGAEAEVELLCSYDPVINNAELVTELETVCHSLGYHYEEAETAMTGEDFGFFTSMYPGLLFWLGSGCNWPLHSEKFLPLDECLEVGIKTMLKLAGC